MEVGTLGKVLHDFLTTEDGELSLCKGEYFLVHKVLDKHWCYGQSQDKIGKFPSSHLHKAEIPDIHDDEVLFISIAAFRGEQPGDLSFAEGEIILGMPKVGTEWCSGQIQSRRGIFPKTHVWQIDSSIIKKMSIKKFVRKKAKVRTTLKAQLEEELDLTEGEIVTVSEILDDGWCYGETEVGRKGTFPEGFISYIEDIDNDNIDASNVASSQSLPLPLPQNESIYKDFSETFDKPCAEKPPPCYHDLFPDFSSLPEHGTSDYKFGSNSDPFNVKPYAMTLYPFNAQFPNELSFTAGQVVHLIKYVDTEWMEGMLEDVKGIFPLSYVNIIVDCHEVMESRVVLNNGENNEIKDVLEPSTLAKVEYTFEAQMAGDLSVTEGDIVTVVEMANADWVSIKDKNEQVGLCPRGYLAAVHTVSTDCTQNLLDDFVVIRSENDDITLRDEQKVKRLSEPHRPAPPAPAPGRIPLQKQTNRSRNVQTESTDHPTEGVAHEKQRKAEQRQNVISELVITEKEYVRDLKLTYETFNLYNPNFLAEKGIDVTILFGNLIEVIQVAEELLDIILRAMKGCDEGLQKVGPCFIQMADKLRTSYVKYCSNHESSLALLKKYENNEEIMAVFNKGTETLRYQIACFDMSSILIKPVQRILKYPLILHELVKSTEDNHPDKAHIEEAWQTMMDVASYINEYKRRKDIVSKYLENHNTLMSRMAKLNMHSVDKKAKRLSSKLSASLGGTNVPVDTEFEEFERQFRSVEKCIWQLIKDVDQCIIHLCDEAIFSKLLSDSLIQYQQGARSNEVESLRDIRSEIWSQYIPDIKTHLERKVIKPLNILGILLEGPAVLITKRYDKLLDYDAAISKSEKYKESKIAQEELMLAKSNFEALNQQLVEELPILIDAATKILINSLDALANARKLLSGKITKRYLTFCETAPQLSPHDILESFLVNHSLLWNQITRFTFAETNSRAEQGQSTWCPQNDRQKMQLQNKYAIDKLYIVTESVVSTSSLDMGAAIGTIVAVIKSQDPMGDSSRWYVDNGVSQGFLPSHKLKPLQYLHTTNTSTRVEPINCNSTPDLISMDSPEKEIKSVSESNLESLLYLNIDDSIKVNHNYGNVEEISTTQQYQNLTDRFYYASFDFSGDMPGTLSVASGQALKLIRPHDEKGNNEWWFMQDRHGNVGYVPQNHMKLATYKPTTNI